MEEKKEEQEGQFLVVFEPDAYIKAFMHVLRFASNALNKDSWVEVYGWLVGKIEEDGKILHIYDAVPMHHGKDIEVRWEAETYTRAADFDEKLYQESQENPKMKNMFVIGWYHSHPGLDFFLSSVDTGNHLYFQSVNPHSIAIVFDHTKIDKNNPLGFKIYQLDDPADNSNDDYHEVDFKKDLFPNETIGVIRQIQTIIENIQVNQLYVTEYGETPTIFSHLLLPGATPAIDKTPPLDLSALFEKMVKSTGVLIEKTLGESIIGKIAQEMNPAIEEWYSAFIPYVVSSLNKWMLSLAEKLVITNKLSLASVYTIAGTLEKSMKYTTEWTKAQLSEHRFFMKKDLDKAMKTQRIELQGIFDRSITSQQESLTSNLEEFNVVVDKLKQQILQSEEKITNLVTTQEKLQESINQITSSMNEQVSTIGEKISSVEAKLATLEENVGTKIKESMETLKEGFNATLDGLDEQLEEKVKVQVETVGSSIDNLKGSLHDELEKIVSELSQERAKLEELSATKAFKQMQKEMKNLNKK